MGTLDSAFGAAVLAELGGVCTKLGDRESALRHLLEAKRIKAAQQFSLENEDGANLINNIGCLQYELVDLENALASFVEAKWLFTIVHLLGSKSGRLLLKNIDSVQHSLGRQSLQPS